MSFITNQGIRIHFQVEGEGPPLVLQHSFGQSLETWYDLGFVERLEQDYRLILIDSRGHGASEKLYDPDAYGLKERATDVVAVLDSLNVSQVHYFGYSLGGWIGFGLAKYAPERVRSLALGGAQPYGQNMALYRTLLQAGLAPGLSQLEKAAGSELPAAARQGFLRNDVQALVAAYHHDRPNIFEILPEMKMPCLLFVGEADPLCPAVMQCAAALGKARFISWPGLNHIQLGLQIKTVLPPLTSFLARLEQMPAAVNQPPTQPLAEDFMGRRW